MTDIEIKRDYEALPDNNVRFGIRVTNNSSSAISDVEVILDYNESLFNLDGHKIQKLGTIPPTVPRTAKFILKPLGCIHKENIGATVIYKDHQWKKHTEEMRPKEVHCVCPFLKEKSIKRADFLTMSKSGFFEERGLNFEGITVEKLVEFISHTCKNRLYKVDEFSIGNGIILYLAGDAVGEKAYYLLTAVVKEYEGLAQVLFRANSDKNHGLNGFLNEILDNLRHLVISANAREIGIIKKEQVINIIDSFVQRSSFSVSDGAPSVNIRDSIVRRAEIKADEGRKRREEERRSKKQEEQERLRRQNEEEAQREREELARKEEEERQRNEEEQRLLKKKREEGERKAREDRERKTEADRREREKQKAIQEEDRKKGKSSESARIEMDKGGKRTSKNNFFAIALVLCLLALGYWGLAPGSSNPSQTLNFNPDTSKSFIQTSTVSPALIQKTIDSLEFISIPAGEFDMGSPSSEEGRFDNEGPVHHVKISKAFYLGKYEVTQKQWRDVMGSSRNGDNLPVETVSWNDAQSFIKKLNDKEGGNKYRLPTEAEWEYAARAGTTTRYSFGDDELKLGDYAWYNLNSNSDQNDVGQKKPNPWGLYDMYGNVREWVQDKYHTDYIGAPTDGSSWESGSGSDRVVRGGMYTTSVMYCRSASRSNYDPSRGGNLGLGFRLVRIL